MSGLSADAGVESEVGEAIDLMESFAGEFSDDFESDFSYETGYDDATVVEGKGFEAVLLNRDKALKDFYEVFRERDTGEGVPPGEEPLKDEFGDGKREVEVALSEGGGSRKLQCKGVFWVCVFVYL